MPMDPEMQGLLESPEANVEMFSEMATKWEEDLAALEEYQEQTGLEMPATEHLRMAIESVMELTGDFQEETEVGTEPVAPASAAPLV